MNLGYKKIQILKVFCRYVFEGIHLGKKSLKIKNVTKIFHMHVVQANQIFL